MQHLYSFYHTEIDLSLDRVRRFMARLGDPHLHLPPVVHIAGTNGKGSTLAVLQALLEASGKTVHMATSPHLVHATERIRLAGQIISTAALVELLEECLAVNREEPITFFEMFMAATFLAFLRTKADYCLLETGMGGRLDATNIVPDPVCTIITNISHDHQAFLGETLPEIAAEKAGIMKPGIPCIIGRQTEEAQKSRVLDVLHRASQALSPEAPLVRYGADWRIEPEAGRMRFAFGPESFDLPQPNLCGSHQIDNAGTALAAYRVIAGPDFDPEILSTALGQIHWPGRLERLENRPLAAILPEGWEIVLDGGHNEGAGRALAAQAQQWAQQDGKPLHLIVAMVDRKDPAAFLAPLLPCIDSLTVTDIPGEGSSYSADDLFGHVQMLDSGVEIMQAADVFEAVTAVAGKESERPARILITGSLYFLGSILAA